MKSYIKYIIAALAAITIAFCVASCDSFVEVDLPNSQLTGEAVFETTATADAALLNIYARMRDRGMLSGNSAGMSNALGNYADELDFYGNASSPMFFFNSNSLVATNGTAADYWNNAYNQIYQANAVLEGVAGSTGIPQADKDRMRGEALFLRALLHFYLTNLYGEIPYVMTTDYEVNKVISKSTQDVLYAQLIDDLEMATTLLPEAYLSEGKSRANRYAAFALLSRVYLYNGQWAEASNAASAVINQEATYSMAPTVENVFLKNSPETILQMPPANNGAQTELGTTFNVLAAPPANSALRNDFLDAFETGDLRQQFWMGQITGGSTVYYFPRKYRQYTSGAESTEYSILLRLPEVYLIRAEARAMQGELTGAAEDLDAVRLRAGLVGTTAQTQTALLLAIARERRVELFAEYGHRFFDLKRTGAIDVVLGMVKPGWNAEDKRLPLPQNELTLNPNLLPQNSGY